MRLIDADALVKAVQKEKIFIRPHDDPFDVVREQGRRLKKCVMEAPTIEAVPVVQAEWTEEDDDNIYSCSFCKESFFLESGTPVENCYNFCPSCGAKMKEENL